MYRIRYVLTNLRVTDTIDPEIPRNVKQVQMVTTLFHSNSKADISHDRKNTSINVNDKLITDIVARLALK